MLHFVVCISHQTNQTDSCAHDPPRDLNPCTRWPTFWSLQLIGRAVEALLKSDPQRKAAGGGGGWGGVNVLCYGFRKRRPAG